MGGLFHDTCAGSPNWYAIYCKHRHERVVHGTLTTKGINSYLAEYETRAQWGTRLRKIKKNWLPGYVLVQMPAHDAAAYLSVLQTHGVVKFVGRPWPQLSVIPIEQVDSVRLLLGSRNDFEETVYFSAGETVEVIGGPFTGLVGKVLDPASRRSRVVVSIDLLRRSVAVEVDSGLLRRLRALKTAA